jgi:acyl-CoA thioester hydrolase
MSNRRFTFDLPSLQLGLFDIGGVLYHANYLLLLEQVREAFLREAGISAPELASRGSFLAITETRQNFVKPIRYGDIVVAEMWAEEVRAASLVLAYSLQGISSDGAQAVVHVAETRMCYVTTTPEGIRPSALPEDLRAAFGTLLVSEK